MMSDYPKDTRAMDGLTAESYRLVRSGGRVKYAGIWWQHDKLIPLIGEVVYVCNSDYWRTEIDVCAAQARHELLVNIKR